MYLISCPACCAPADPRVDLRLVDPAVWISLLHFTLTTITCPGIQYSPGIHVQLWEPLATSNEQHCQSCLASRRLSLLELASGTSRHSTPPALVAPLPITRHTTTRPLRAVSRIPYTISHRLHLPLHCQQHCHQSTGTSRHRAGHCRHEQQQFLSGPVAVRRDLGGCQAAATAPAATPATTAARYGWLPPCANAASPTSAIPAAVSPAAGHECSRCSAGRRHASAERRRRVSAQKAKG